MLRKALVCGLSLVLVTPLGRALAQDTASSDGAGAPRQRGQFGGGQFAGMQRAGGEVTAVSGATITIKTETGGTMQIVTTDNTRIMKGRPNEGGGVIKVGDLKVGDGVMAMGNLDAPNKTIHAAMVMATDAAQLKALKDNLGKTYIAGKVTGIDMDDAKLTVLRSDGVSQTIGLDEATSFRRGRVAAGEFGGAGMGGGRQRGGDNAGQPTPTAESITLADIKVGDNIGGKGSLKAGVFVPTEVVVATPGQRRSRNAGSEALAAPQQ
ncbi:hypothetical protein [Granulicella paludicola]|uniref:hypothetical protein n=1 Tax=Granulicella paludicola TaxID=474951 RepID=UPI0021E025F2|nr:hypothetical protein [Granulicella paludicola]